jgi:hypothetical protein
MTLKQLTWRLIIPLTIISFGTVTKWWYVLPVDAPDTMMIGFPLAFAGDGWFTSMSFQIFILEFIIDFTVYFLFWFLTVFFISRYFTRLSISKTLTKVMWTLAILITIFWSAFFSVVEKVIVLKRDWHMQVVKTGYKFTFTHKDRPDFPQQNLNKK